MRFSSFLVILTGLGVAGGSVYLARDYLETQAEAASESAIATVSVMVAARDIPFGQPIEPHLVTALEWPTANLPGGAITDASLLLPSQGGQPRRALRAIAQGELITTNRVSNWGEKVTIAQTLREGTRAMAISVGASTAVGGFVTPGDFVDIVLTQGGVRTLTILQNIRVIGVDQNANEDKDNPTVARTVTVEVTPEQGQRLALAQTAGSLSLALRDPTAAVDSVLEATSMADLLNIEPPPVVTEAAEPAPAPVRRTVVVRRAGVPTTEEF